MWCPVIAKLVCNYFQVNSWIFGKWKTTHLLDVNGLLYKPACNREFTRFHGFGFMGGFHENLIYHQSSMVGIGEFTNSPTRGDLFMGCNGFREKDRTVGESGPNYSFLEIFWGFHKFSATPQWLAL